MSITLLTPTGDRPEAFALLERWVAAQTVQPDQWIVVDDGKEPTSCTMRQERIHVRRTYDLLPHQSQAANLLVGLELVRGEYVVILEDDDYYAPGYLEHLVPDPLPHTEVLGMIPARYYNVRTGRYKDCGNTKHASLAQTVVRGRGIEALKAVCRREVKFIDKVLWQQENLFRCLFPSKHHIGIKGMPGRQGIGVGHRQAFGIPDCDGKVFEEWGIPDVYRTYREAE